MTYTSPVASRSRPTQLRDLGVDGGVGVGHDEAGVELGVSRDEAACDTVRGVGLGGDAEKELEGRVVDACERLEVVVEIVVSTRERLEDCDRRRDMPPAQIRVPSRSAGFHRSSARKKSTIIVV